MGVSLVRVRLPAALRARRAIAAAAAVALVGSVFFGLSRADGLPSRQFELESGGAWLASPAQGVVSLIDGPAEQVVGLLPVPQLRADDDVSVAQAGSSAYVANATAGTVSRVDGATFEVSQAVKFGSGGPGAVLQVFPGPSSAYVVDGVQRVVSVVDPKTMNVRKRLSLVQRMAAGQAVVDGAGRLWTIDGDGIARFDQSGKYRRSDGGGPQRRLVLVRDQPMLVDLAAGRVGTLSGDGQVRSWSCLDVSGDDGAELAGSSLLGRVLAIRGATGTLVESGDGTDCGPAVAGLGRAGDRLGAPVESAGYVLVPNWTTGKVDVLDLTAQKVVSELTVTRPDQRVELLLKDGVVFYNNLDGSRAGVIQFDGTGWKLGKALRKFGTGKNGPPVLTSAGDRAKPRDTGKGGGRNPNDPGQNKPGGTKPTNPTNPSGPNNPGNGTDLPSPPPGGQPDDPLPPGGQTSVPPVSQPPSGGTTPPAGGDPTPPVVHAPVISDITPDPLTVQREHPVTFTATVTDTDGATWAWQILDGGGNQLATGTDPDAFTYTPDAGSPAQQTVRLTVTNKAGSSAPFSRDFETSAGATPHIDTLTASNQTPDTGTSVRFDATGTLIEDDPAHPGLVTWTWDITNDDNGTQVLPPTTRAPGPLSFQFNDSGHFHAHLVVSRDGADDDATSGTITAIGQVTLTVAFGGDGTGTVADATGKINCTRQCSATYRQGDQVSLTASPHATVLKSRFQQWTGAGCGTSTTCTFTIISDTTVTASFQEIPATAESAFIDFQSGQDGKDSDTRVTVTLTDRNGLVFGRLVGTFGEFAANSDSGQLTIPITSTAATFDSAPGGEVRVHIDPNGNDTWFLDWTGEVHFASGQIITFGGPGSGSVSEDRRDITGQI
jgi:Divergent InlB B-repeat domain/PKD domain